MMFRDLQRGDVFRFVNHDVDYVKCGVRGGKYSTFAGQIMVTDTTKPVVLVKRGGTPIAPPPEVVNDKKHAAYGHVGPNDWAFPQSAVFDSSRESVEMAAAYGMPTGIPVRLLLAATVNAPLQAASSSRGLTLEKRLRNQAQLRLQMADALLDEYNTQSGGWRPPLV